MALPPPRKMNSSRDKRQRGRPMMASRRRPRLDLEQLVRLTVTVINAVASLIDELRKFH